MSFIVSVIALLLFTVNVARSDKWDCADYYWRDYFGTIPDDAVPAGTNDNGDPRYIGLVYIRGYELLPATIYPKQGIARTTAYAHVLNTTKHVKILCSPYKKDAFEWIPIESKNLHEYESRTLIPGGSEVGESLYIGRVFRNNDVIVGKIFRHERTNKGIWFPLGNGPSNSLIYEVLLYNCNNVPKFVFDVRSGSDSSTKNNTPVVN